MKITLNLHAPSTNDLSTGNLGTNIVIEPLISHANRLNPQIEKL